MVFLHRQFAVGNRLHSVRMSRETHFRFRLRLKITLEESTYPSRRPQCPSNTKLKHTKQSKFIQATLLRDPKKSKEVYFRRGQVKEIRSDNGTKFTGAERELRVMIGDWNQVTINEDRVRNCDSLVANATTN